MPQFQLDHGTAAGPKHWASWDPFTRAYVEALFWTEGADQPLEQRDHPTCPSALAGATLDDLSPEAVAEIAADCRRFQETHAALLAGADPSQAGHDYWLTRNGHGAGFWDRDPGCYPADPDGRQLTEAAHAEGESDAYIGDDGRVYVN